MPQEGTSYSSLCNITNGAYAFPPTLIKQYDEIVIRIQQVYGITGYTDAVSFWKVKMDETKFDSMEKTVFHGKIKIVNQQTKETVQADEIVEICCFGPQVFKGYWNKLEETEIVLRNGLYYSGDGVLYVIDRLIDMIISGGGNKYSAELESVISKCSAVLEVAVIGVPNTKWGEIPKAYIVQKPGHSVNEEEIFDLCQEYLASYKCVKEIEIIDQLPRNAVGEILKRN